MRALYVLCFIFALPFMAALGHDLYKSYNSANIDLNNPVQLSDLGWLWLEYHKESFLWLKAHVDNDLWFDIIDPLLEQSAVLVTLVPLAFFVGTIILLKIIAMGPWNANVRLRGRPGGKGFSFRENGEKKPRAKYKRR